jgi:lysophospholipase L1-like esterase
MDIYALRRLSSFRLLLILVLAPAVGEAQALYDSLPRLPELYTKRTAVFKAEKVHSGCILFLGNSITEGGDWRTLLKDSTVLNRGISGDITFGILKRLDEVTRHQPLKVFLLIGINDLAKNIPTAVIIQNIFNIVGRIRTESPKTHIYVQSLLPVNPGHKKFPAGYKKQNEVLEINSQLAKYAEALKYTFVNLHAGFLDDRMALNVLYTYDGLHLNKAGYAHWLAYLKKEKCL